MPGWTLVDTHPTQGRIFQRPLGADELTFLWEGLFNGSTDSIHHYEIRLVNGSQDAHFFSAANIMGAWLSAKRRYPLVGASLRGYNAPLRLKEATYLKAEGGEDGGGDNGTGFMTHPHFVVREQDLSILRPREIVFGEVADAEEAQRQVAAMFNGSRSLSEDLLVQLYIFRETDSKRTDIIHLMPLIAHCIADRLATDALVRCFLDTLARGGSSDSEPAQASLEDRLAMQVPLGELEPIHLRSLSPAIRRWRRAVGAVIARSRKERLQGGHTLPRRVTRPPPYVAARSGYVSTLFTQTQSAAVFSSCHLHNITFGSTCLALAQVAMTRVLYRRYLRGEVSDREWAYRKRQPHIIVGPVNLRPYLDQTWFDGGGGGEFMLSTSLFYYQLPFMTLGATTERHQHLKDDRERVPSDGAPPFSDLLTFDRFLHRVRLARKQITAFFKHPLLFEITYALSLSRAAHARRNTLRWMRCLETDDDNGMHGGEDEVLSIMNMPMVRAHGGSSFGSLDSTFPSEYPIPPTHPLSPYSSIPHPAKAGYIIPPLPSSSSSPSASEADTAPKIAVESMRIHLHASSSELYLGASTFRGRLSMFVYYDGNVFEEGVVREWLDETREAVLWYLGRTHPLSRRARQSRAGGGDGQAGVGEDVRARL